MIEILNWALYAVGALEAYVAADCSAECNKSCSTATLASYNFAEESMGGDQILAHYYIGIS